MKLANCSIIAGLLFAFVVASAVKPATAELLTQQRLLLHILKLRPDRVGCVRQRRNAPIICASVRYAIANSTLQAAALDVSSDLGLLSQKQQAQPQKQQVQYRPPRRGNIGKPRGRNRGAASRGDCLKSANQLPLIALAPTDVGQTVMERPILWFYIPYSLTSQSSVHFSLRQENDRKAVSLRQWQVMIPDAVVPGIIQVPMPIALEPNQEYRWIFKVSCQDAHSPDTASQMLALPPDAPYVDGVVERIVPSAQLTAELQRYRANPRQQAIIYAANGIWFDALNLVAELRRSRPQDPQLQDDWRQLLNHPDINMKEVSDQPLRPCCKLRKEE